MKGEKNMKKTFFSGGLYLQSLKRLRTVGIAMMVCIVLLNLVLPMQEILKNDKYDHYEFVEDGTGGAYINRDDGFISVIDRLPDPRPISDRMFAPFLWAVGFFGSLMIWLLFSFLNERHKSDFYHSLPQTRVCVYFSMIAAAFTWLMGTIVVSLSLSAILWSFARLVTFDATVVLSNLLFFTVLAVFMSGFMAVSMMISGTVITNLLSYVFLLLFPPYVISLFICALDEAAPILVSGWVDKVVYSFNRFLLLTFTQTSMLEDIPVLVTSLVIGVAMFVLAGVLYHFRRSESAGKSAPNALLQHVYRIVFTSAAALLLPFVMIMDGYTSFLLFIVVAVVLVYVIYELMTTKKLSRMVRSLPLLVIPFVIAGVFFGSVYGIRAYIYSVRPEKADVTSVSFENMRNYDIGVYGVRLLSDIELTDRALVDFVVDAFHETLDDSNDSNGYRGINTYAIKMELANGKTLRRSVRFLPAKWSELCRMDGVKEYYLALPAWEDLDVRKDPIDTDPYSTHISDEVLWRTLLREYEALTEEEKFLFVRDALPLSNTYTISLFVESKQTTRRGYDGYGQVYSYSIFPDWMPETTKLITEGYGEEEKILEIIRNYESSSIGQVKLAYFDGNKFIQTRIDTKKFYETVKIDSHLFAEEGEHVQIVFGSQPFWVRMTAEEKKALFEYAGVEIVDSSISFREEEKYTTWEE